MFYTELCMLFSAWYIFAFRLAQVFSWFCIITELKKKKISFVVSLTTKIFLRLKFIYNIIQIDVIHFNEDTHIETNFYPLQAFLLLYKKLRHFLMSS